MKRSGQIIKFPDGRIAIKYADQPLEHTHKKLIFHVVDSDYKAIIDDTTKKQVTITKSIEKFNEEISQFRLIGYVD